MSALGTSFRWRWKTGERVASFSIAYTTERGHFVFALALRVPHCACAEPRNCGLILAHGNDTNVQCGARNSDANAQHLRLLLYAIENSLVSYSHMPPAALHRVSEERFFFSFIDDFASHDRE